MSWWITLVGKDGVSVVVDKFTEGGTYPIGGTTEAEINVTYNYGWYFNFKQLDGMTAKDSIELLENMVNNLGTEKDPDYWKATKGNVGRTCAILLKWARAHPGAIWEVD